MSVRTEVLETYERYLAAFAANDMQKINEFFVWPCAFIGEGKTVMVDKFPINLAEMRKAKNWAATKANEIDVVAASATKAHVVLRNCVRVRPDGSAIEEVTSFYAFTKTPSGWKVFAVSAIEFPR